MSVRSEGLDSFSGFASLLSRAACKKREAWPVSVARQHTLGSPASEESRMAQSDNGHCQRFAFQCVHLVFSKSFG